MYLIAMINSDLKSMNALCNMTEPYNVINNQQSMSTGYGTVNSISCQSQYLVFQVLAYIYCTSSITVDPDCTLSCSTVSDSNRIPPPPPPSTSLHLHLPGSRVEITVVYESSRVIDMSVV